MNVDVAENKAETGRRAAKLGAERLRQALQSGGEAAIILATGASQFEMFDQLVQEPGIDWSRVTAFHLDEYVGISADHPAAFRRYMRERFVDRLPSPIGHFHYIDGNADPEQECRRLAEIIRPLDIRVAFVGIGENGHLAFNDPPADFDTTEPYLIVRLDEASRQQQFGEGWFESMDDVPRVAISMSVSQIMSAATIVCTVPDERKAAAVREAVEGPVTPRLPASILQKHPDCHLYLDTAAATLLAARAAW